MASPSKLCNVCLKILQSGLEGVEKSLHKECAHHKTFNGFKQAAESGCFICARLWDALSDISIVSWEEDPASWKVFDCWVERRPWASERVSYVRPILHKPLLILDGLDASMLESSWGDIESSTSSEKAQKLAYGWQKACQETHEICSKLRSSEKFAPSRLIDIGAKGDTWRLCLYPEDIADPPDYFTLSYRWTKHPSIVLLSTNINKFRQWSPISRLPKTFRDTITVARRLSIRYLWIDSLCIIQDSPEDWAKESVRMHQIYANSSCTISASASEDPQGGLFRSRTPKDVLPGYVTVKFTDGGLTKFDIWDEHYIQRLTQGPLTRRGWVYQERILSPGVLHFTDTQIVWECFEMSKCEMFPWWSPYPTEAVHTPALKTINAFFDSDDSASTIAEKEKKIMGVDAFNQWTNLVKVYSKCEFTHPDDRLMAMAGIAEIFKKNTGDQYLAVSSIPGLLQDVNRSKDPYSYEAMYALAHFFFSRYNVVSEDNNLLNHLLRASVEDLATIMLQNNRFPPSDIDHPLDLTDERKPDEMEIIDLDLLEEHESGQHHRPFNLPTLPTQYSLRDLVPSIESRSRNVKTSAWNFRISKHFKQISSTREKARRERLQRSLLMEDYILALPTSSIHEALLHPATMGGEGYGSPPELTAHSTSQQVRTREIGSLGELFVHTLFERHIEGWSFENWTSKLRVENGYEPFTLPEGQFADFTYLDHSGYMRAFFLVAGLEPNAEWSSSTTYHVEVKTTTSDGKEPFFVSQNQVNMMRSYHDDGDNAYIRMRVSQINNENPELKCYPNPWVLHLEGTLQFTSADGYKVRESRLPGLTSS
ncbi:hypothetical protein HG530_013023 [Fusarium avenaceum]|nr:hypothetical protein HG530_013023 [Fusarium avenaceum]